MVPDCDRRGIQQDDIGGIDAMAQNPFRKFHAAGWWADVDFTEVDQRTIGFAGMEFDEVADVVDEGVFINPRNVSGGKEEWLVWERFAMEMGDIYGCTTEEKEEAFWRTLVADSDGQGSLAPEDFGVMYRCWRSDPGGERRALYASFTDQLCYTTSGRKIFLTKRGYLGERSGIIETGDTVCILKGGKLPIIGRKTGLYIEQVTEEDVDGARVVVKKVAVYSVVGSGGTYLHGLMDGEALGIAEEEGKEVEGVFFC